MGKLIVFSAPSGSGKTTIVHRLMGLVEGLEFSVSATSRSPRGVEQNGKDYYFLSGEEFDRKIAEDAFVEWEEVYAGTKYGTLRSELERIWAKGHTILFDVDVKGGVRLKDIFGTQALSIFIMPPSVEELERRLRGRGDTSEEQIKLRMERAVWEMEQRHWYDHVVVNDVAEDCAKEILKIIAE